jgi:hypothetical protein
MKRWASRLAFLAVWVLGEVAECCPALDAVGSNAYAGMLSLPEGLARRTEFLCVSGRAWLDP